MKLNRRQLLCGSTAALACARTSATEVDPITPEQFGAKGDGVTNDSRSFDEMSRFANARGGGEIHLRPVTYIVGEEVRGRGTDDAYAFSPVRIMNFVGCTRPLTIRGNGARLKAAAGLRYGTFNPATGTPTHHPMPYQSGGEIAAPYHAMIWIERCGGSVEISDLELDGNMSGLLLGGPYGDVGRQLPATGIQLVNNRGAERLRRVRTHHHGLDGIIIDGVGDRTSRSTFEDLECSHNGRQGCSIVGGQGYDFLSCKFEHTGKGAISSPPGAGVDIEAEGGKRIRDLRFQGCQFTNNVGAGLVADNGDSQGAQFDNCKFVGTTDWAAWPNKPRFRFTNCTFVGPIVHAFGDANPQRACQFHGCSFLDDPALSPTREIYGGENLSRPIADLPGNTNVLFEHCSFRLTHRAVLPWSVDVIFSNCTMSQRAQAPAYPRGTFVGRNVINGKVDLYGSKVHGELIVNGKAIPPTR